MFDNPKVHIKLSKSLSYGRVTPPALLSTITKNKHYFSIYLFLCQEWLSTQRPLTLLYPPSFSSKSIHFIYFCFFLIRFRLFFWMPFVTDSATKVISLSDDSIEAISSYKNYPLNLNILQTMRGNLLFPLKCFFFFLKMKSNLEGQAEIQMFLTYKIRVKKYCLWFLGWKWMFKTSYKQFIQKCS